MKAYPIQRLLAYFMDFIIVTFIVTFFSLVIPESKNLETLQEEQSQVMTDYLNGTIDANKYIAKSADIAYDISYASIPSSFLYVIVIILYFIVLPYYNKGQTLGKKVMKIRIVREDEKQLTMNDLLFRSLIINMILLNILDLSCILFIPRNYYFYISSGLQFFQVVIVVVSLGMVFFRKDRRGLHDIITHTKVIVNGEKEMEVCEN